MSKHLLTLWDLDKSEIGDLLSKAPQLRGANAAPDVLKGKTLALIFEKASTRTKVSFSVAAYQLGAQVVSLEPSSSQLGRGESYADTARVLSQYVDGIVVRTFEQENVEEMATYATVPVINGLTDQYHPCQVLADLLTVVEETNCKDFGKLRVSWLGDGNNMTHSWVVAAAKLGFTLKIATPQGREPDAAIVKRARDEGANIEVGQDPMAAIKDSDVVNTDTWESMGQETETDVRPLFASYQVNQELLQNAAPQAIVLHCLPAHREDEITSAVMDGPQSRVWQQAANRLPMQKAILAKYMGKR